jgi:hypothetical protein
MPRPRKSVSQKRLAANRANAARSTGPRTPQGKARSAQNALKHGFTASTFAVVRLEDLQEIAHLRAGLIAAYRPVNAQELFAIERIALAQQVVLRAARLETGLFTTCLNQALDPSAAQMLPMNEDLTGNGDISIAQAQNRDYLLGEGFHRMAIQSNSWTLAKRYQAQAERHYRSAVEEFDRLKALRPKSVKPENRPILYVQPSQRKSLNSVTGRPISTPEPNFTPVAQTPPSAAAPPAGLSSQPLESGWRLLEHQVGQAASPVLPSLPPVFGPPHPSDTTSRGSEGLVRTPR